MSPHCPCLPVCIMGSHMASQGSRGSGCKHRCDGLRSAQSQAPVPAPRPECFTPSRGHSFLKGSF